MKSLDFADKKLHNSQDPHNLDKEEIAALNLYTSNAVYRKVNQVLREENRHGIRSFAAYIRLLYSALSKLPSKRCSVTRAVDVDLTANFSLGKVYQDWTFTSTTVAGDIQKFLGRGGSGSLFTFHCNCGKDVANYSNFEQENEILLPPGYTWKVENAVQIGPSFFQYAITQVEDKPHLLLLKPRGLSQ